MSELATPAYPCPVTPCGSLAGGDHEPHRRAPGLKALLPGTASRSGSPLLWKTRAPGSEPTLRSGVADAVTALASAGVDAILFNCCQPEVIEGALKVAVAALQVQGAHRRSPRRLCQRLPPQPKATANDGLDEIRGDLGPLDYLGWAERWRRAGANLIGGCCGIGPEHIEALASRLR